MTPIEPHQDDSAHRQREAEINRRLSDGLSVLAPAYAEEVRKLKRNARLRRTGRRALLPLALSLTALLFWGLQSRTYVVAAQDGRPAEISLWDGSHISVDAGGEVELSYLPWPRQATLTKGTALFEIRHIAVAPFTMRAGQATITDLGTRFLVRAEPGRVSLSVFEGAVGISTSAASQTMTITAGHGAETSPLGGLLASAPESEQEATAWRDGRVVFSNVTLAEAAATLERYWPDISLRTQGPAAGLRLSGSFSLDQREELLRTLETVLPIKVQRSDHDIVFSLRRNPT